MIDNWGSKALIWFLTEFRGTTSVTRRTDPDWNENKIRQDIGRALLSAPPSTMKPALRLG